MSKLKFVFLLAALLISGAAARVSAQDKLPPPNLVVTEIRDYEANGRQLTLYRLDVENKNDFPAELFEAAPDLPPCGRNANASRTWVNIFAGNGNRIYGFCSLKSPSELSSLAFNLPRGATLDEVYIVISDRRLKRRAKSNSVSIKQP